MKFLIIEPHETYESSVHRNILELTARGRAKEALEVYVNAIQLGAITSARTHHAAFVAAREANKGLSALFLIEDEAVSCKDFEGEVELNFDRDWAVYDAEVASESDFTDALQGINDIIRRRTETEGLDSPQLYIDNLALAKIVLLSGDTGAALDILDRLLSYSPTDDRQTACNVNWWYFVATLRAGDYDTARLVAQVSIDERTECKPVRRRAYWLTIAPIIGPPIVRRYIERKLGLN